MQPKTLNWSDIQVACLHIYDNMRDIGFKPNAIIGLLRGGVIPARMFSDFFDIMMDFYAIDVKLYTGIGKKNDQPIIKPFHIDIRGKNILVIDDIWDSGKTMEAVLEELKGENVTTATLYWKESAKGKPNYYYETAKDNEWIVFPWEKYEYFRLREGNNGE